ncbi:uncharacterized protein J4E92_002105 [Alternaria infectoria]|uniref:uncharacterized protein n=1 Tax=Alternaria infectoria TaxID=45303 RepID=UPI00221FE035|nr:uncharacterized protein J4E92_002105 [Alternaria infectoria]KAI4937375.1 hypothetical protein J4E92_002105 [Alternaria infectoria]
MAPTPIAKQMEQATKKDTKAAAPSPNAKANLLASAFVTAPGSKKAMKESENNMGDVAKIYELSHADRKVLATGPKVQIVDSEGKPVAEMPIALFRAVSIKKEMVAGPNPVIKLPAGLEVQMVQDLITHFNEITTFKKFAKELHAYKAPGAYQDLQLCSAADYLGMMAYTQRIFNRYWALIRAERLPEYTDIDAFSSIQTPIGENLFRKVVTKLAQAELDGKIPDPEDYAAYLVHNERFGLAVTEAKEKMQKHQDYVERTAKREANAKQKTDADQMWSQQRKLNEKEKAEKDKAKWEAARKTEAELAARVQAKWVQPGKKHWTAEEAGYLRRVRGINVAI